MTSVKVTDEMVETGCEAYEQESAGLAIGPLVPSVFAMRSALSAVAPAIAKAAVEADREAVRARLGFMAECDTFRASSIEFGHLTASHVGRGMKHAHDAACAKVDAEAKPGPPGSEVLTTIAEVSRAMRESDLGTLTEPTDETMEQDEAFGMYLRLREHGDEMAPALMMVLRADRARRPRVVAFDDGDALGQLACDAWCRHFNQGGSSLGWKEATDEGRAAWIGMGTDVATAAAESTLSAVAAEVLAHGWAVNTLDHVRAALRIPAATAPYSHHASSRGPRQAVPVHDAAPPPASSLREEVASAVTGCLRRPVEKLPRDLGAEIADAVIPIVQRYDAARFTGPEAVETFAQASGGVKRESGNGVMAIAAGLRAAAGAGGGVDDYRCKSVSTSRITVGAKPKRCNKVENHPGYHASADYSYQWSDEYADAPVVPAGTLLSSLRTDEENAYHAAYLKAASELSHTAYDLRERTRERDDARAERDAARAERDNLLDAAKEGAWMARALDAEREVRALRSRGAPEAVRRLVEACCDYVAEWDGDGAGKAACLDVIRARTRGLGPRTKVNEAPAEGSGGVDDMIETLSARLAAHPVPGVPAWMRERGGELAQHLAALTDAVAAMRNGGAR